MTEKNDPIKGFITDEHLSEINGGVGDFQTASGRWGSGGDKPLYELGDIVKLRYYYRKNSIQYCTECSGIITYVTPEKSLGLVFKEWGYTIQITAASAAAFLDNPNIIGTIVENVMEPAIFV